ncbi:hypothetical protein CYMTET_5717 [Cymbomonas tetramitiformis]|uniref:Uncharacterized protein n=1 Tax=Cymbomonas tetramitiformis TaxID=36881 RepID=A0AAE0LJ69_9CHLO|nr:hypothetical protein CYMTET_5717 [Cymbomonas tetramitiformis]
MEQFDGELQSAAKTEEPKLKDSVMPAPVMPAPNASCRQLAKKEVQMMTTLLDLLDDPLLGLLNTLLVDMEDHSHRGRALLMTMEDLLRLYTSTPPGYSESQYDMPTATGLSQTGPFGVHIFYKALTLMPGYAPQYPRRPRGVIPPMWMEMPEWPLAEQISMLDRDWLKRLMEMRGNTPMASGNLCTTIARSLNKPKLNYKKQVECLEPSLRDEARITHLMNFYCGMNVLFGPLSIHEYSVA